MMDKSEVVLITGCTEGGIGHALACEFSKRHGYIVFATARRPEAVGQVPAGVHVLPLEVTDPGSITTAVETVIKREGRIDILINNAGVGCIGPLAEISLSQARQTYEVNVLGALSMIQAIVPHMASQGRGKIINVGSIVGLNPILWSGVYSSSKAAVHNLTDTLRLELWPFGIQVMLLAPGAIISNMGSNSQKSLDVSHLKVYRQYSDALQKRAVASQSSNSTPTDKFAKDVADQVTKKRMPR